MELVRLRPREHRALVERAEKAEARVAKLERERRELNEWAGRERAACVTSERAMLEGRKEPTSHAFHRGALSMADKLCALLAATQERSGADDG